MDCKYQKKCGGCPLRELNTEQYRQTKISHFQDMISHIHQTKICYGEPVFIADGNRRRAELTFKYGKGQLIFGFSARQSHDIVDIFECQALTPTLNLIIKPVREFLQKFCVIKQNIKVKNKIETHSITQGKIWLTQVADGVDILLEVNEQLALEHRMEICDFVNDNQIIIRFSVKYKNTFAETVIEKYAPYINISGQQVHIPAGTFLQPSEAGENALIALVQKYIGENTGNIADLFCGVGTFSYPLAQNIKNKITAADSSAELLSAFQQNINRLMLPNIKIFNKNLFKYPFDSTELKAFDIIIFDPPRAGAAEQIAEIAAMKEADKAQKIVAVSCNPHTFINDANTLIKAGYFIKEITLVDQFVYTEHFELVALFMKKEGENL